MNPQIQPFQLPPTYNGGGGGPRPMPYPGPNPRWRGGGGGGRRIPPPPVPPWMRHIPPPPHHMGGPPQIQPHFTGGGHNGLPSWLGGGGGNPNGPPQIQPYQQGRQLDWQSILGDMSHLSQAQIGNMVGGHVPGQMQHHFSGMNPMLLKLLGGLAGGTLPGTGGVASSIPPIQGGMNWINQLMRGNQGTNMPTL